ncbi:MAG: IS1634 family transposase, partial [Methylobacter sp.]|nr:IS1634 family transposase [Methylobacter sp.]
MFIRKKVSTNPSNGKVYTYYQLVESRKIEKGSRSFVILYLGSLDISRDEQKIISSLLNHRIAGLGRVARFSDKIEELAEQIYLKYMRTVSEKQEDEPEQSALGRICFTRESVEMGQYRSVGAELIGMHYWKSLKFDQILEECSFTKRDRELARAVILGRLISPGSERHTLGWFHRQSCLFEFSRALQNGVRKDSFYRVCDRLHANKDRIEAKVRENLKRFYGLVDRVYLYDLTNTYFEGNMLKAELCKRGKSKEKRSDCPLVTLALVVDQDGFPVYSKIYRGNQSEPETLKHVISEIYDFQDDVVSKTIKPSIVMDRGIATKENIAYLRKLGCSYFVIERRNQVDDYRDEFDDIESFELHESPDKPPLLLKKISLEDRTRVLVYSKGKAEKESSMMTKQEQRFLEDVNKLLERNRKGKIKDAEKILIKIGRMKEKYSSIAGKYEFKLMKDETDDGKIKEIQLDTTGKAPTKSEYPGCYVIETDKDKYS